MSSPQVNGEMPHHTASRCISHLYEYPFVHDSVESAKRHPMGKKSIQIGSSLYQNFGGALACLRPFMPILSKADEYGEKVLCVFDNKFPAAKKPTDELYKDAKDLASRSYHAARPHKEHVAQIYHDEQRRAGGSGLVASGTALVNTTVVLGAEICGMLYSYFLGKRVEARENGHREADRTRNVNSDANKSNGAAH